MTAPAFTREQHAAIGARSGSSLLTANAGSGKTAVMVERIAAAVREDGVPVSSILALTFTEKAAGELAERLKKRLAELGEAEHARAVDSAWIGTIHGFCARLLRSQPLAAGLDPRFEVLDEPAAGRLATAAFERAFEAWGRGAPAIDLAASYGPGLRDLILGVYATLRARGDAQPRLQIPAARPAPDPAAFEAARAAAMRDLAGAGDGVRVAAGRLALATELPGGVPWPGALDAAELKGGAKALATDACEAYRAAWSAYRADCAEFHARDAVRLLDALLNRFGAEYADAKAARAAVDFEDLELRARDLLADPAGRGRWAERFALIMIDEFQDTNAVQLGILEGLERDNLFAVGDEFQSIYRFRHADVGIFRARAARLGAQHVRTLAVNFRSREELLDVLNATFAPELGERFAPLRAGRREVAIDPDGALRLFDLAPAGAPPVEFLITDTHGWDDVDLGLAAGNDQPWRRAEARLLGHRLRTEVDAGRRPGEVVVLVRATSSLRLLEQALEEQGLPTYVVGGRGYWSQEQVRDGLAWLRALANPHDEEALLTVLASPFCGATSDDLVLLAQAGRARGGLWPALQAVAAGLLPPGVEPDGPPSRGVASLPALDGPPSRGVASLPALDGPPSRGVASLPAPDGPPSRGVASLPALDGLPSRERIAAVARLLARERARAERAPLEVLLERAIVASGYDLAVLSRPGGDRRLANLRKLMRLAREFERSEGRDLRGFLADAAARDLAEAREGEAALESEGLDAVRLMTIHRAKGLEFPVVCVADLGRAAGGRRPPLLVGHDGTAGLRLAPLGGGDTVPTEAWERLAAAEAAADAEEERRLFYVAVTRARDLLILSGGTDTSKWPGPRNGGPPIAWIAPAVLGDPAAAVAAAATAAGQPAPGNGAAVVPGQAAPGGVAPVAAGRPAPAAAAAATAAGQPAPAAAAARGRARRAAAPPAPVAQLERSWDGRAARVECRLNTPATLPAQSLVTRTPARAASSTALPAVPAAVPAAPARARPAPQRLSFSQLSDYGRCGYRFYLTRVLRLPRVAAPAPMEATETTGLDPMLRGSLVHRALEDLDFARPAPPDADALRALAAAAGAELTDEDVQDISGLVARFAASRLCARLAAAPRARREAGFSFALDPDGSGPLVSGFVDVLAHEPDGSALVVDYKSHRLADEDDAEALIERDYATQRLVYALAALRAGAPRVEVAHCLLERPDEPVSAVFTAADAPDLAGALSRLARGVLEHEYPVARQPHRDLCGDCPGRRALCSYSSEETLRPPPAPSPAAPVRRSRPEGIGSAAGPPPR